MGYVRSRIVTHLPSLFPSASWVFPVDWSAARRWEPGSQRAELPRKHPVNSKQMPRTPKTSPTRAPPGKRAPAGRFQVERLTAGLSRSLYLKPVGFETRASFAPGRVWGASPGSSPESPSLAVAEPRDSFMPGLFPK